MNRQHLDYLASPEWAAKLQTDLLPWIDRVAGLGVDVLEIGPGPGLTTDILRTRTERMTAVEIDAALASGLSQRLAGTNVDVIHGDGAHLDFADDRFTAVTCFSVLHHVPSPARQDEMLREILRVLQPGASLLVTDARDLELIRGAHEDDTFVPLPIDTLAERLNRIGFVDVQVEQADYEIRFVAGKP